MEPDHALCDASRNCLHQPTRSSSGRPAGPESTYHENVLKGGGLGGPTGKAAPSTAIIADAQTSHGRVPLACPGASHTVAHTAFLHFRAAVL